MSDIYPYRHFILGGLLAFLAYFILQAFRERFQGSDRAISQFVGRSGGPRPTEMGSWKHKVQLFFRRFHWDASGQENLAFSLLIVFVSGGLVLAIRMIGLPPVAWLGGLVAGIILSRGLVTNAFEKMTQEIEKEIPTLLIRFSGMVQASPNVLQALEEIGHSLDPDKPLREWLLRMVADIQARGTAGLEDMQNEARSLSAALLLAVIQIRRVWETGGRGHIEALQMVADHLSELVATRGLAQAKAGRSWGTVKIIIFSSVVSLGFILNNPASQDIFLGNPLTRFGLAALVVWGGFGWAYIHDLIRKVTE